MTTLGRHVVMDFKGVEFNFNNDELMHMLEEVVAACGARILSTHREEFPNGALSGVVFLAESHATIHTWPEHNALCVDLFVCSGFDTSLGEEVLKNRIEYTSIDIENIARGVL